LSCHKCKQCLLVAESLRFDAGVRGNAIQIEGRRRSEQVASGTLGNEGKGEVQGVSLRRRENKLLRRRVGTGSCAAACLQKAYLRG
jgi:hypothetical protein